MLLQTEHPGGIRKTVKRFLLFSCLLLLSCVGIPKDVEPVQNFKLNRYLGSWYEIARLDHSFERGLEQVTALYTLQSDGGIEVRNRGYDPEKKLWKEAQGRAYFVEDPTIGRLKVSFFGPFYGGYNIIALDEKNYRYALVCGYDRSQLWILSRSPKLERWALNSLLSRAKELGFDVDQLIYVNQLGAE